MNARPARLVPTLPEPHGSQPSTGLHALGADVLGLRVGQNAY